MKHNHNPSRLMLAVFFLACMFVRPSSLQAAPLQALESVKLNEDGKKYPINLNNPKEAAFLQREGLDVYLLHGAGKLHLGSLFDEQTQNYQDTRDSLDVLYGDVNRDGSYEFFLKKDVGGTRNIFYSMVDAKGRAMPVQKLFTKEGYARFRELFLYEASQKLLPNPYIDEKEQSLSFLSAIGPNNVWMELALNSESRWQPKEDFVPYALPLECPVLRRAQYDAKGRADILVVTLDESGEGFDIIPKYRAQGLVHHSVNLYEKTRADSKQSGQLVQGTRVLVDDIVGTPNTADWVHVTDSAGLSGWMPVDWMQPADRQPIEFCAEK